MGDNAWDAAAFISVLWLFVAGPYLIGETAYRITLLVIAVGAGAWLIYEGRRMWKEYRK